MVDFAAMSPRKTPGGGERRQVSARSGAHGPWPVERHARVQFFALAAVLLFALIVLSPLLVALPPARASALTDAQAELARARADLNALYAKVDGLAARKAKAQSQLEITQERITQVQASAGTAKKDLTTAQGRLQQRVRRLYMDGSSSMAFVEALVAEHTTLLSLLNRVDLLQRVAAQDQSLFDQVARQLDSLRALDTELQARKTDEQRLSADAAGASSEAARLLEASKSDYQRLRSRVQTLTAQEEALRAQEAARAQAASAGGTTKTTTKSGGSTGGSSTGGHTVGGSGWVFPVQGPNSFTNTWGYPRGGGRTHQGTDIMSPRGTPVVAVVNGTVSRAKPVESGLGGITIWLDGNDRNSYYYAHLSRIEGGISSGTRVGAGQVIGYVGNTGDARSTDPHLHFEIRPGGGSPINPYATLVAHR